MSVTVSFRKDRNRYRVNYYLADGTRKKRLFVERSAAEKFAESVSLGKQPEDEDSITIDQAGKKYFQSESVRKDPKSRSNEKLYINLHHFYMTEVCGHAYLSSVSLSDLEGFREWLPTLTEQPWQNECPEIKGELLPRKKMRWGPKTVNRCLAIMKHFYRRHVQWKSIPSNPTEYLELMDAEDVIRPAMSADQFDLMLAKIRPQDQWAVRPLRFMYLTGSPAICVQRLNRTDVNFPDRTYSTLRKKGRKAKWKRSYFGMTDEVFAEFVAAINEWPDQDGAVFRDFGGRRILADRLTEIGNDAIRAAGLKGITLYGLRHALATDLTEANVATEKVRQAMGHASIATTQRYANKVSLRSVALDIQSVRGARLGPVG